MNGAYKGTSGGLAYSFSGCTDDQTSADTSVIFHYLAVCIAIMPYILRLHATIRLLMYW